MVHLVYAGVLTHSPLFSTSKHICPVCGTISRRPQEQNRHYETAHLPCWIFCPYQGCNWRGDRKDEFQRHLDKQQCGKKPAQEQEYQIYDVKMASDWIKNSPDNDARLAVQNFAIDLVKERALELGKQEWLVDPWGRSNKQAIRD